MREARRDPFLAGQLRLALEHYRAELHMGGKPELTEEVFVALQIEGLNMGHPIMFRDELPKHKPQPPQRRR